MMIAIGQVLLTIALAASAPPEAKHASTVPRAKPLSLAPIKSGAVSVHSPFEVGDCSLCHQHKNKRSPGAVTIAGDKLCFVCHEDFQELSATRRFKHAPGQVGCTGCHNPHNAAQKKLLLVPAPRLCLECHTGVSAAMAKPVKHAPMTEGASCMSCHDPHASNVEHLLSRLPFDLCVGCHNRDDVADPAGAKLTNIGRLLEENKVHHGPVAQKDCSACHEPHGASVFRLLIASYPATFYAPFNAKDYEMCFGCHDDQLVTAEKTTTATRFRDGDRNLHFLHVNKPDRGRTCRACHEVHAAQRTYQIRESVPYGKNGYMLKVNFEKHTDGGSCSQTCHTARTYTNAMPTAAKTKGGP